MMKKTKEQQADIDRLNEISESIKGLYEERDFADAVNSDRSRIKEIEEVIDKLYDERNHIRDRVLRTELNEKLARIMDKWVLIPGFHTADEMDDTKYFRLGKVVGVEKWRGNNEFELVMDHLVYLGHANKGDTYDHAVQEIMFTNGDDKSKHVVGDIDRVKVITARKASKLIEEQMNSVTRRLKRMQDAALTDYGEKEMYK